MDKQALQQITLTELVAACKRETARFQHSGTSAPRYCLELFHRALRLSNTAEADAGTATPYADDAAREQLVLLYTDYILAQINRAAIPSHWRSELVQDVWRNFWQAANHGLAFNTLAAALAYLKQVTVSEVIKYRRRKYRRAREESLQELTERVGEEPTTETTDLFETHVRTRFRERCAEVIRDSEEYRIFWLRYGLGYRPKEIARLLTDANPSTSRRYTERNVSDILERCFRRLSEDSESRALLQSD